MQLNGRPVSRETGEILIHFAALFEKWAKTINLVASSTKDHLWERHIADSAQIHQLQPAPGTWIDFGSGGGFPGIITAIFLKELGAGWVHLVESNNKKAAFLRTALIETGARGTVHSLRIQEAKRDIPTADFISARAIADLDQLCAFSEDWMAERPSMVAYFHKGRDYRSEVEKARGRWAFDLIEHQSKIERASAILEITNLRKRY